MHGGTFFENLIIADDEHAADGVIPHWQNLFKVENAAIGKTTTTTPAPVDTTPDDEDDLDVEKMSADWYDDDDYDLDNIDGEEKKGNDEL